MADGVLGKIAAAKREELALRYDGVPLDALRARARPTRRSLPAVLAKNGARFILEIKKASPSAGAIRLDSDPASLARGYAGVGDALSVLCHRTFFGGSLDDLAAARGEFDGPILAKDFFIDPRQVVEARIAGADAVLVMLSLLDDRAAREMMAEARRFGMDSLVEVHDETEMRRALALGVPLIGINNRDLRDLRVDLATTERLAPLAPDRTLVSESGISTRADVERLSPLVGGFLVGSALMRADEPAQAARELIFGRTKLCGLNSGADLRAARPAALAGFVFVPGSPRHVTAQEAAPLGGVARKSGMLPVGVFRDAPWRIVSDLATLMNLHAVQLHGHEDAGYVRALRRELPRSCEIWTAFSVGREPLEERGGDRLVFDNGDGGSGRCFDWSLIRGHAELPRSVIAGGIGVHNARAARALGGHAIDVGSALDARPGRKSPEKIAQLFEALRPVSRQRLRQCA
ncbi:MAG TPA: bifunctional indole-3-glycerol-phosphate synthase TrpC/phosphoribosylanthranilate isomerase TrpF [Sphingomicrobium sp.]|nr:bifunctional indole-3-glycerol-phosphate synthase TrpC/phosphoribosylanthranilate isomerase TrpF [Sphingomicrobium sp.]